ncbi:MAG: hypothetical protein MUQ30_13665 [Anaerolineae bacterium]|nr:hypothetical protein [Anaerolineae bacterium]
MRQKDCHVDIASEQLISRVERAKDIDGLGVPVYDGVIEVTVPAPGGYDVWARTRH